MLVPMHADVRAVFDLRDHEKWERKPPKPDVGDVDTQQVLYVDSETNELLVENGGKLTPAARVAGYLGTLNTGETVLEFLKPKRARLLKLLRRAAKELR